MPSPTDSSNAPHHGTELDVVGAVPAGLSGRLTAVGADGVVYSLQLHASGVSLVARRVRTARAITDLISFEGSVLGFADDSSVHELSTEVGTSRRVELAGQRRQLVARPTHDTATGELHLVARDSDGALAHVVIAAGALTRRSRPIIDARRDVRGLALGADDVVYLADGAIGVMPRDGEVRTTWIATDAAAPRPVHVYRAGATVVLLALTPSVERWSLHVDSGAFERELIDPTARRVARVGRTGADGMPRCLWTTGHGTIRRHDLDESLHVDLDLSPHVPGDFVLVVDAAGPGTGDGGWFVGFVHDTSAGTTDLWVIDTDDLTGGAVATIGIPRPVPVGLPCAWTPLTPHRPVHPSPQRGSTEP